MGWPKSTQTRFVGIITSRGGSREGGVQGVATPPPPNDFEQPLPLIQGLGIVAATVCLAADKLCST